MEKRRPLRRQPNPHNFGSLIMLAVTAGAFLLVTWGGMKAVFLASFGLPLVKVADLTESDANLLASVYRVTNKAVAHLTSNSGHPQIDLRQYYAACPLLHTLLRKRLLSRY